MQEINKILNNRKEICFIDFEGTQITQEIIAIGAIKVLLDAKNQVKSKSSPFKVYVKSHGKVGKIVRNLTGIDDQLLKEQGVTFKEAIERLRKYLGRGYDKLIYSTYGNYDMRMLHVTAEINNMNDDPLVESIFRHYWDFSSTFTKYIKSAKNEQLSLKDALKVFKLSFDGEEHDPSYDAINLMRLYDAFITQKGIVLAEYKKTLDRYNKMPRPFQKVMRKLNADEKITKEEYIEFIIEELK